MQTAPHESSQTASTLQHHSTPDIPFHDGLTSERDLATGDRLILQSSSESVASDASDDAASATSSTTNRGRWTETGRLSHDGSPGGRVAAYERANVLPRKQTEEVMFKVVPSPGDRPANISIMDFPNGRQLTYGSQAMLIQLRGLDPRLVASPTRDIIYDEFDQLSLPQSCYHSSRMAHRFCPLLLGS